MAERVPHKSTGETSSSAKYDELVRKRCALAVEVAKVAIEHGAGSSRHILALERYERAVRDADARRYGSWHVARQG